MLTKEALGAAIRAAIVEKKKITPQKVADDFGVKAPSVQGWMKTGRISKPNFEKLRQYMADVVGPEHWGLSQEAVSTRKTKSPINPRIAAVVKMMEETDDEGKIRAQSAVEMALALYFQGSKPKEYVKKRA
ncbi:MAG: hypothetical protein WC100_00805 [Sterolibacterium sp.]